MGRKVVTGAPQTDDKDKAISLTKQPVGNKVEGLYKADFTFPNPKNKDKTSHIYTLEQKDGKVLKVFGVTDLDNKMKKIAKGTYVYFEYLGKQPVKNVANPMHLFNVELEEDPDVENQDEVPY